jgi:hypothetical protein
MRSERRRVTAAISASPTRAPAQRTSVSCSAVIPDARMTFETVPLIANRVAAIATIA